MASKDYMLGIMNTDSYISNDEESRPKTNNMLIDKALEDLRYIIDLIDLERDLGVAGLGNPEMTPPG